MKFLIPWAFCWWKKKKYDQAAIYLQMAADALPGRSRIHYNLGLLLQFLKKREKRRKGRF